MQNLLYFFRLLKGNKLLYFFSVLCVVLAVFGGVFEPLIIKTAVDFCVNGQIVNDNLFTNYIEKYLKYNELYVNLLVLAFGLVLVNGLSSIMSFLKGYFSSIPAQKVGEKLRRQLFSHVQDITSNELSKIKTGDWVQRCTSDVNMIVTFLESNFVEIVRVISLILFVSISMAAIDLKLVLAGTFLLPFIIVFSVVFFRKVNKAFKIYEEAEGAFTSYVNEYISGIRTFKTLGRQEDEYLKFDGMNVELREKTKKLIDWFAYYWSFSNLMCYGQSLTVIIYGAILVSRGETTVGTISAFVAYGIMLSFPMQQLGRVLSDASKTVVSIKRVREILDSKKECYLRGDEPEIEGQIAFDSVSFSYDGKHPTLKNVSFKVLKGQTLGIIGPTGAGKSTLVNLMSGLYDCNNGLIEIDGCDLSKINKKWLRSNIGVVSQEAFLFSRTIKKNTLMAKTDANKEDIDTAYANSSFKEVVHKFELGEDTLLGERGVNLSGGQRQRLSLARTLIRDYPILVFDDSGSALDAHTEEEIRIKLKDLRKDKTTVVISHRISAVCHSDLIIVMDKGQILEKGSHGDLIDKKGMYYTLCCLQDKINDEGRVKHLWKALREEGIVDLTEAYGEKCSDISECIETK